MKKLTYVILILAVLASPMAVTSFGYAEEMQDNATMAASYEKKAADLDKEITYHEWMKREHRQPVGGKFGRRGRMDSHCDAIIAKAETLRDEYLEMAEGFRTQG